MIALVWCVACAAFDTSDFMNSEGTRSLEQDRISLFSVEMHVPRPAAWPFRGWDPHDGAERGHACLCAVISANFGQIELKGRKRPRAARKANAVARPSSLAWLLRESANRPESREHT